jgi:branched-chain amino acid transport system substrate-binding protein
MNWPRLPLACLGPLLAVSCASLSAVAHAETLKVGFVTTLSTPAKLVGGELRDGFVLALDQIDRKVGEVAIEAIVVDDAYSTEVGLQATKTLIDKDNVDLVTGFLWSDILLSSSEYALAAGKIVIGANAGPSLLAGRGCHRNFFNIAFQNDQLPEAIGKFVRERGRTKAYVVVPDYAAGTDHASGFERGFAGDIVGRSRTRWRPTPDLDFEPILRRAKDAGADTIFAFYPGGKPGFEFLRQFKTSGLVGNIALATSFTVDELSLRSLQEHNVGGVWGMLTATHWAANLEYEENIRFVAAFMQRFGRTPTLYAAQGYDLVQFLKAALERTKGKFRDQRAFREALRTVSWPSTRGPVRFGRNQFLRQNIYLATVVDGEGGWTVKALEPIEKDAKDAYADECKEAIVPARRK